MRVRLLPAVRRRAPPAVRVGGEAPPQQELLVLLQQRGVVQDVGHLPGGQPLGALGAAELDAALGDLDAEVLAEAAEAGAVAAAQQLGQLLGGLAHQAQGALQEGGLPRGQGRLAGGQRLGRGAAGGVLVGGRGGRRGSGGRRSQGGRVRLC